MVRHRANFQGEDAMSYRFDIAIPSATLEVLEREAARINARGTMPVKDTDGTETQSRVLGCKVVQNLGGEHVIALEMEGEIPSLDKSICQFSMGCQIADPPPCSLCAAGDHTTPCGPNCTCDKAPCGP
jgi:hypothetical protein